VSEHQAHDFNLFTHRESALIEQLGSGEAGEEGNMVRITSEERWKSFEQLSGRLLGSTDTGKPQHRSAPDAVLTQHLGDGYRGPSCCHHGVAQIPSVIVLVLQYTKAAYCA